MTWGGCSSFPRRYLPKRFSGEVKAAPLENTTSLNFFCGEVIRYRAGSRRNGNGSCQIHQRLRSDTVRYITLISKKKKKNGGNQMVGEGGNVRRHTM
ncbi:hypothetical protein CDAR_408511 [Caerostris darwini]|uniref:Uncharacterized protein n=1 Tax=Caerostris darwini TaxID=1538125 RepID=A0AAV4X6I2_9ARAC|nr:hypothetical protein CDAR_408511 [Caerostris darwini]